MRSTGSPIRVPVLGLFDSNWKNELLLALLECAPARRPRPTNVGSCSMPAVKIAQCVYRGAYGCEFRRNTPAATVAELLSLVLLQQRLQLYVPYNRNTWHESCSVNTGTTRARCVADCVDGMRRETPKTHARARFAAPLIRRAAAIVGCHLLQSNAVWLCRRQVNTSCSICIRCYISRSRRPVSSAVLVAESCTAAAAAASASART